MRVCFVSAPTASEFDAPAAESRIVRLISEQAPIGVLTLAAVLEQRGIAVEVVDLNRLYYRYLRSGGSHESEDFCAFVARELKSRPADVWGFSTMCSTYPLTLRIAAAVKRSQPEAVAMLGGPQASVVDVATMQAFPFIDYIVRGEADETLPLLLDVISDARGAAAIPGITFRCGDRIVRNPNAPAVLNLDQLPMPAFHLCPEFGTCAIVPLELGRGCPFACKFCSTNDFFRRRFRLKSPARVIEQMRFIRAHYGIHHFELIHDMFTVDRKRVAEFCEALLASGEQFHWNCSARTDCVDDELIALMARAGCRGIFFGIETGSARLQQAIDKNLNLCEAASRIRTVARQDIGATVSLITGFPDETREDLRQTVAFLMDAARCDQVKPQLHILAPLAATPIHEEYRDRLKLEDVLSDISCHGWRQDPADQQLIAAHPDIFPNFYAVPTSLDREYLKELRDFIQHSMLRFRWLLVALYQDSGDLLQVFDGWREWRTRHYQPAADTYYSREEFVNDFLEFAGASYLPRAVHPAALTALLQFERALFLGPAKPPVRKPGMPSVARGVRIVRLAADYHAILTRLRNGDSLASARPKAVVLAAQTVGEEQVRVLRLSPFSAQLLSLIDGARSMRQIASRLRLSKNLAGIPRQKACLFGLNHLRAEGLIEQPAPAHSRPRSLRASPARVATAE